MVVVVAVLEGKRVVVKAFRVVHHVVDTPVAVTTGAYDGSQLVFMFVFIFDEPRQRYLAGHHRYVVHRHQDALRIDPIVAIKGVHHERP